jgi:hypothetical protein
VKKSRKPIHIIISIIILFASIVPNIQAESATNQTQKIVIIGGGHVGLIEAYLAYTRAKKNNQNIQIEIYEKNKQVTDTTAANIWNSHTPDEIVSVVPRGSELQNKLKIAFDQPGGIRVDDVSDVNNSESAHKFVNEVVEYSKKPSENDKRTEAMLRLGRAGMALWKQLYETADEDLKAIFKEANFNPCCEVDPAAEKKLHQGYRIDLIYNMPNANNHAKGMLDSYKKLGYNNCQILSPDEVVALDPSLSQYCDIHAVGDTGKRQWKEDSIAVWRPGGCLDTQKFLPALVGYLQRKMGADFQIHFNKKVTGVVFARSANNQLVVKDLKFADGTQSENNSGTTTYVFCPGEAVGTLKNLGFQEPAYAGFAGASLCLNVPVSAEQLAKYEGFSHYMEVHGVGIVLAWQARIRDGKIFVGGAGTKSFYADKEPTIHEAFAKNRNLVQLRMFNDVLPWVVSIALNRDTTGQLLTEADLKFLEDNQIAKRWVGRRAVVYDGFPTLGRLYHKDELVANCRATTHAGSGGGSFALISSLVSKFALHPEEVRGELKEVNISPEFAQEVLLYGDSRRKAAAAA